jgi:putative peptidoglycan lipid II flippase
LAIALFPLLHVPGLALAFAIAYIVGAVVALLTLQRRAPVARGRELVERVARVTAASVVMGAVVFVVSRAIGTDGDARLLANVVGSVVLGATVYLVTARLLGVAEVAALLDRVRPSRT